MSEELVRTGRPIGSTGVPEVREVVQSWKPAHDQVVLMHLAGYTNVRIAELTDYTPEYVGQLLLTPQAKALIEQGRKKIREALLEDTNDRLLGLARLSLDNLEKTVKKDIPVNHPAKRHQDKIGVELLKMIGYGSGQAPRSSGPSVSEDVMARLTRAIERSNESRGIPVIEAEVVEENTAA